MKAARRAMVTGATGVIGRRVVPELLARGYRVTAVGRTAQKRAELGSVGADAIALDILDVGAATRALAGHDVLINLATHMPKSTLQMLLPWAWRENDRVRRDGRERMDAAMAQRARRAALGLPVAFRRVIARPSRMIGGWSWPRGSRS